MQIVMSTLTMWSR